jgi:catalase
VANRHAVLIAALAVIAGCGHRDEPPQVGEQIDPSERYFVPSIVASARKLVDDVQKQSGPLYRRDAHAKAHGCLTATFTVRDDLPDAMRTGVFVPGHQYKAWIRFSNGNAAVQPDHDKDARGMAIKLMGVEGPKLLDSPADKNAQTQDFLMINFPVFFNRDPAEYERFIRYQADGSQFGYFFAGRNPLDWRWRELFIGGQLLGRIRNPLYAQYYSMTSYAMGVKEGPWDDPKPYRHAMKYSAKSCTPPDGRPADVKDDDYLRRGLVEHLAQSDGCFEFLVQLQDPSRDMPVEDPTVRWKESQSPFVPVADIHIPSQEFDTPARNTFCENLSFNPWHAVEDHRPLGGLNRIRKAVYEEIAVYRHAMNGNATYREPTGWCVDAEGKPCDAP